MNNEMFKAVITRTRLQNGFLQNRRSRLKKQKQQQKKQQKTKQNKNNRNRDLLRKQFHLYANLLRKSGKKYFAKLNEKQVTDNKRFWKTVTPIISNNLKIKKGALILEKKCPNCVHP